MFRRIILFCILTMFPVSSITYAAATENQSVSKPRVLIIVSTHITEKEGKKINDESMGKLISEREELYKEKLQSIAVNNGYKNAIIKFDYLTMKTKGVKKKEQRNFVSPIKPLDVVNLAKQNDADYVIDILAPFCWTRSSGFLIGQTVTIAYNLVTKTYDANGNLIGQYQTEQSDSSTGITIGPLGGAGARGAYREAQIKCLDDLAVNIKLPAVPTKVISDKVG